MTQKRGYVIDSPLVAGEWLKPGAYLRVVFMGASRSNAIGLRWQSVYQTESDHIDPHQCSKMCQYCQVDILSVCGGCIERMDVFNGKTTLYNTIKWMPYIFALETITVVLSGYINFEVIFNIRGQLTPALLWKLIQEMNAMHYKFGGRSEFRYSASKDCNILYLDMAMRKNGFQEPFKILSSAFGVTNVALHPGKFNKVSTHPCTRVTISYLMGLSMV
jgi:hypothetical protein